MSHLTDDHVIKLRQLLRREDEEAGAGAQQAGLGTVMAVSAEASQPAQEASRPSGLAEMPEQARHSATSRGPAWLHRDPSAAHTKDFPALPTRAQPDTGKHRQVVADMELADLSSEMHLLSGGNILKITCRRPNPRTSADAAPSSQHIQLAAENARPDRNRCHVCRMGGMPGQLLGLVARAVHRISTLGTVLNSIVLIYITCYPAFFVLAANHLRNVSRSVAVPLLRTAFVVTRAPSEPWDVAKSTLTADA